MPKTQIQVLLIEDTPTDVIFLREALAQDTLISFELTTVERLQTALEILQKTAFDIILLDLGLPDSQGLETFTRIHVLTPAIPKVILSGLTDEVFAVQAVHAGAQDYLVKGTAGFASVARAIRYAIERHEAQLAVRASEERFRAMIENGLDDISLLDAHGNLLWESPAVVRNLGYPENMFVGQNIFEIVHPEDKAWTSALYDRLIEVPGSRQEGKFRLQRSDGTWRWVEAIVTNLLDNPSVQAIVVNYRDITERKQAEENYQAIFEKSAEGIFQSSPEGRFINVNPAMAHIYGYASPQEMIEAIHDIAQQIYLEPQERAEFTRLFNSAGSVNNFEMKNKRKDGSVIWTSTTARTVRATDGKLLYYEGLLQDITERKQAEAALRANEERYRGIFDGVQDAIFVESLKGEILDVNQRACEIFGYTHAEFITKQVSDIVPSEEHLIRLWDDENISLEHSYETLNVRASGEQFPVEIRGGFYEFGDRKLFLVVLRDITERKQAEEKLHASETRYHLATLATRDVIW
jgi:PAS domain S-box-containing protein